MRYNFKTPENAAQEGRSLFANRVCCLLVKSVGSIENAIVACDGLRYNFEGYVRNIYELENTHIPLFALKSLIENSAEDLDLSEKERDIAIIQAYNACELYYCTSDVFKPITQSNG